MLDHSPEMRATVCKNVGIPMIRSDNGLPYTKSGIVLNDLDYRRTGFGQSFGRQQGRGVKLSAAPNDRWGKKCVVLAS